jgi:hypothetical protein
MSEEEQQEKRTEVDNLTNHYVENVTHYLGQFD